MSLLCQIRKDFRDFQLDVDFTAANEVHALLGASGCGKSMTLKCIAGIVTPDSGRIVLDGVTLFDSDRGINLQPQKRRVGLLFQDYALFPNMTVRRNVEMGVHRSDRKNRDRLVADILAAFRLEGLEGHYPDQLSGGQKQRCALARIMVGQPDILMLDEPFSALDSYLRWQVEMEVAEILHRFGKTVLFVSHDRDEVFRLCDTITVIDRGHSESAIGKRELFSAPSTQQAALLSGCKNISPLCVDAGRLTAADWALPLCWDGPLPEGVTAVGIRAHSILPAHTCDPLEGDTVFHYEIAFEMEDSFQYILMIRPQGCSSAKLIRWDVEKPVREEMKAYPQTAVIRRDSLLLLR